MTERVVELSASEFYHAANAGLLRFVLSKAQGRPERHVGSAGVPDWVHVFLDDVLGACGELAVAKSRNDYWAGAANTFHAIPDVGLVDVRSTLRADGALIIRDNDDDDRWFVLVTGTPPILTIRGCITGREAKRPEWIRDPGGRRPSWFVPQSALRFRVMASP